VYAAGQSGFGFGHGEVWGIHLGWSGNQQVYGERMPSGVAVLGAGEVLLPGELILEPGVSYTTPWLFGSYGVGLDAVTARFHEYLRARPIHPVKPRPVVCNVWEAVYFDHRLDRLVALADAAATVGVERYVLDDGWFRHRRDDSAGLGDWYVDEGVWPDGLNPLIDHVRGLGMEFGLWFEPEMVNQDSDLARAHPDWILSLPHRMPPEARHQQVLDLGHPDAYAYLLERMDAILTEYDIGYVKWDHNRELVDAGHHPDGTPGVHNQTLALYRLLDELKARHPGVEIESCSSGDGRVDLGIIDHTDRVWGSDCIDALERQAINRGTSSLLPLELIGSHIGSPTSHTTGRTHTLAFRAGTAIFGHLGIEWDMTAMSDARPGRAHRLGGALQAVARPPAQRPARPRRPSRPGGVGQRRRRPGRHIGTVQRGHDGGHGDAVGRCGPVPRARPGRDVPLACRRARRHRRGRAATPVRPRSARPRPARAGARPGRCATPTGLAGVRPPVRGRGALR